MRKLICILITFILFISVFNIAYSASNPIEVYIDGTKVNFSPEAFSNEGCIYVPMDTLCSALGADIKSEKNGKNDVYTLLRVKTNRILVLESGLKTAKVNGNPINIKFEPILYGEIAGVKKYTFVPLEFVVERLGGEVSWNKDTNKAYVNSCRPITLKNQGLDAEIRSQFKIPKGDIFIGDVNSIETLDLSSKSLADVDGLQYFENLTSLNLSGNLIKDLAPLGQLKNINELDLSNNNITKIGSLENLTNLKKLSLASNQISDISLLSYNTNLEYLDLDENDISDLSPVKKCTNLKQLSLVGNSVPDISNITGLVKLETLDLSGNDITGIAGINKLVNLKELYLTDNLVSEISPVCSLANLEVLDITANDVTRIEGLENLKKLKALYLSENNIAEVSALGDLTGLQMLDLADNRITKVDGLNKLSNLTTLYLKGNNISDYSPLKACSKLVDKDFGDAAYPGSPVIIQRFYIGRYNYNVNGEEKKMDTTPVIKGGRTFLPIRYVSETIGASVGWKPDDQQVTVTLGSNVIVLWVNKDVALVNGSLKELDAAPFILKGRTVLPIRFVSENLGLTVNWDPEKQEVTLSNSAN